MESGGESTAPPELYVPDTQESEARRGHFLTYLKDLSIDEKAKDEVGGEDSALVVERDMKDITKEDGRHPQAHISLNYDQIKHLSLLFVSTHLFT